MTKDTQLTQEKKIELGREYSGQEVTRFVENSAVALVSLQELVDILRDKKDQLNPDVLRVMADKVELLKSILRPRSQQTEKAGGKLGSGSAADREGDEFEKNDEQELEEKIQEIQESQESLKNFLEERIKSGEVKAIDENGQEAEREADIIGFVATDDKTREELLAKQREFYQRFAELGFDVSEIGEGKNTAFVVKFPKGYEGNINPFTMTAQEIGAAMELLKQEKNGEKDDQQNFFMTLVGNDDEELMKFREGALKDLGVEREDEVEERSEKQGAENSKSKTFQERVEKAREQQNNRLPVR